MSTANYFIHGLGYDITWALCVLSASTYAAPWMLPVACVLTIIQYAWQIWGMKRIKDFYKLLLIFLVVGVSVDGLAMYLSIIQFEDPIAGILPPFFIVLIWINFSITFYSALYSLRKKYLIMALFGFFGFALAYFAGYKIDAIGFPYGSNTSLLIGSIWFFMFPLSLYIYNKVETND